MLLPARSCGYSHCAYSADSLVWEEVKTTGSPPMGRCDHAMVAVGDRLFIAAGSAGSDLWLNDTFVLSLSEGGGGCHVCILYICVCLYDCLWNAQLIELFTSMTSFMGVVQV